MMTTPTPTRARRMPGLVSCDQCPIPAYRIAGDTLIIEHTHHGQKHVTALPLQSIVDKMTGIAVP